jgi:hypothetical protein
LHDVTARGLEAPLLVISDGQPGLRKALPARSQAGGREGFPQAFHQRCQVHKMRNILAKLPQTARALLKPLIRQVFTAATYEQGLTRGQRAHRPLAGPLPCGDGLSGTGSGGVPGLSEVPQGASQEHSDHESARTDVQRRAAPHEGESPVSDLPAGRQAETACLKLVFATLLTAAQRWRGLRMTPRLLRELDAIRRERYPVQSQVA